MNTDILNACYKVFERDCYNYVIFSESNEGEITYFGMRNNPDVDHLYTDYYGKQHDGGRAKFHMFKFTGGKLEWVESYNFETKMVDMQIDIDDETFLILAKQAHAKNITINQELTNVFSEYIKKGVKHESHKKK